MCGVSLNFGPPAPVYEVVPAPRVGYIWAPGYWDYDHNRHVWRKGHWERERHGQHWTGRPLEPGQRPMASGSRPLGTRIAVSNEGKCITPGGARMTGASGLLLIRYPRELRSLPRPICRRSGGASARWGLPWSAAGRRRSN